MLLRLQIWVKKEWQWHHVSRFLDKVQNRTWFNRNELRNIFMSDHLPREIVCDLSGAVGSAVWLGAPLKLTVSWLTIRRLHFLDHFMAHQQRLWWSYPEKRVWWCKKNKSNQQTRMQSRKTLLWNKLFQKLCKFMCILPLLPYQCRLWSAECRVWCVKTVECWAGNVVSRVWSGDCGVWSVECGV